MIDILFFKKKMKKLKKVLTIYNIEHIISNIQGNKI